MSIPPPSTRGARGEIGPRERNRPIFRRFLPKLRCVAAADLHGGSRQDGPGSPRGTALPNHDGRKTPRFENARFNDRSLYGQFLVLPSCLRPLAVQPCFHVVINLAEYSAPALSPPRQRERKRLRKLPIFATFSLQNGLARRSTLLRSARIQENFSPSRAIDGRTDPNLSPRDAPRSLIRAPPPQFSPKTPKKLAHSPKLPIVTSD